MEAKLRDALGSKDYYSAHQIYLALAQRHSRAKRYEEAKQVLVSGVKEMASAGGQGRSASDLADKLVDCFLNGKQPLVDTDACALQDTLAALYKASATDDASGTGLTLFSERISREVPSLLLVLFEALCSFTVLPEAAAVALRLESCTEELASLGASIGKSKCPAADAVTITVLCLRRKNFAAATAFLAPCIGAAASEGSAGKPQGGPDSEIAGWMGPLESGSELARALNFCQLLVLTVQRKQARVPLAKLFQQYGGLLAKLRLKEDELRHHLDAVYQEPTQGSRHASGQGPDMLAGLLQSMIGGTPGGTRRN